MHNLMHLVQSHVQGSHDNSLFDASSLIEIMNIINTRTLNFNQGCYRDPVREHDGQYLIDILGKLTMCSLESEQFYPTPLGFLVVPPSYSVHRILVPDEPLLKSLKMKTTKYLTEVQMHCPEDTLMHHKAN